MMMEDKSLVSVGEYITLKQLPVIEDTLAELHREIQADLNDIRNLAPTEENYKELKKIRADWNKKIDVLEKLRKKVKAEIEAPYKRFEAGPYNDLITEMRGAVGQLDANIKDVESELKMSRQKEIFEYFEAYRQSLGLDTKLADPRRSGISVGLSGSMPSYKKAVKEWLDKINSDLKTIDSLENRDEIMAEYRITLDLGFAIQTVKDRIAREEAERKAREEAEAERLAREEHEAEIDAVIAQEAQKQAQDEREEQEDVLTPPTVQSAQVEEESAQEKVYVTAFRVAGTLTMLKELKAFLENGGYQYESLKE